MLSQKNSLFILLLLFSASCFASEINVVTDKPLFQFEVGLHASYLNAEDYYQLNTSDVFNTDSNTQLGFDVSIQLHHNKLPQNTFIAMSWSKTNEYNADVLAHCADQSCQKTTKLNFQSLQLNYHYQWHQTTSMESSVYAGISYVLAEGEIKGQAWRDGATGFQVGNQIYFLPHSTIEPYIGVKLSYFAIENADDTIHLPNLSLSFGLRF